MNRIVVATSNAGKLAEFRRLLPPGIAVVGLENLGITLADEPGSTFAENAMWKAREVAQRTGLPAIGDDSGLEVDALGGRPGVRSARYAGPGATARENVEKLLHELRDVPASRRGGRFTCAVAVVDPGSVEALGTGACEGTIGFSPSGTNGFGYDPVFLLSTGRTMAELTDDEKDRVSHRGRAVRAVMTTIEDVARAHAKEQAVT